VTNQASTYEGATLPGDELLLFELLEDLTPIQSGMFYRSNGVVLCFGGQHTFTPGTQRSSLR
jgi:hypothetical protein